MPVTRYVSANGRLRGETTSGTRTDYLTDALGSVTATVNSSAAVVNTYRFKPYGEQLANTGSGADPRYLWTGDTGSRRTNLNRAEQYNVYRHYGSQQAAWTTVDILWPVEKQFAYARCAPATLQDPMGLKPKTCNTHEELFDCLRFYLYRLKYSWADACFICTASFKAQELPAKGCDNILKWFRSVEGPWKDLKCVPHNPMHGFGAAFSYGQYCGSATEKHPCLKITPEDCIDACCYRHDRCLESQRGAGAGGVRAHYCCDCDLKDCAERALANNCCAASRHEEECRSSVTQIIIAFQVLCHIVGRPTEGDPACVPTSSSNWNKQWKNR